MDADADINREDLVELGATKANIIKQLIDRAENAEEKQDIVRTAKSLSQTDLIAFRNDQLGLPDPRTSAHNRVLSELSTIFDSIGLERPEQGALESMAWRLIEAVQNRKGYRSE